MTGAVPVTFDPLRTPYEIPESDFPMAGSGVERCAFLLRYAVLAPSIFNTQPWKFLVTDGGIDVHADMERRVAVADPQGRELLISIGAAVFNTRVAAARFGHSVVVELEEKGLPDGRLARLHLREKQEQDLLPLFPFLTRRHTNREPFLLSRVPLSVAAVLRGLPAEGTAGLVVSVDGKLNTQIADLVAEADKLLLGDQQYRTSLAEWTRPDWTQTGDGIPATNMGIKIAPGLAPWATRALDLSRIRAAIDRNLCIEAPGLVVLTGEESPAAWIEAGQTLERLLLTLVREGLQCSYFNMPVQVPDLRLRLRTLLGIRSWPQLVLRMGYCLTEPRPTPRRPLEDVLLRAAHH